MDFQSRKLHQKPSASLPSSPLLALPLTPSHHLLIHSPSKDNVLSLFGWLFLVKLQKEKKKNAQGGQQRAQWAARWGLDWDLTPPLWLLPNPSPVYHVYHVSAAPPPPSLVVRWLRGRTGQRWGRDYHCLEEAVEFAPSSPRPRPSPNRSPRTQPSLPATFKLSAAVEAINLREQEDTLITLNSM